ncbi:uncharacterized protein LOC131625264 [Vicia villosa]|uniref:uncharacterized protein LOC131625264 n=1 Tax=Vicia villosa TaxID=3911 RepID=UPI00273CE33D|nr:uncharacterized protein LOC131625264 [Vicia villosa]
MSVLVNGGVTKDFKVEMGFIKRDPLSPFLFVLDTEGLTRLVKRAMEIEEYSSFLVNEEVKVDILQFIDDTIILGDGDSNNFWSSKVIFRGFELMSGMKVNFHKSNIYGINMSELSMLSASSFLSCNIDVFPCKFIGVMIGDIPRKAYLWKHLVNNLRNKLSSWKGKNLSMGGRVVMINAVLNAMPVYFLPLYKAPIQVLKEIKRIESNFLWRGKNKRIIHWVSWDTVCSPVASGGLGIKTYMCLTNPPSDEMEMEDS